MKTKTGSRAAMTTARQAMGAILGVGILGALFSAQAGAACMDPTAGSGHQSPLLFAHAPATANYFEESGAHRIVGTWQATYASGGTVYAEAFIQWHSDRTEWENIDFPVLGGNICLGSWKAEGDLKVSRYHVGWLYTNGTLSGHFIETETDVVARDGNSYTGTNDTKFYDLNGNMFREVPGTATATRIAP